jgi:hypothetical protein
MNYARTAFMTATGAALVTLETIIGAILSGAAGVVAAVQCYDSFQSCKHDLDSACSYIDRI